MKINHLMKSYLSRTSIDSSQFFESANDRSPQQMTLTWKQLVERFTTHLSYRRGSGRLPYILSNGFSSR